MRNLVHQYFLNEKLAGPEGHVVMYEPAKRGTTNVKLNTTPSVSNYLSFWLF
jgi:hypothetical protein